VCQPAAHHQWDVLVVEDDDAIRGFVTAVLEDAGYRVVTAANGSEALQRVEQVCPVAILLDMKMPVMDGWTFAAEYRANSDQHAPIIVMTAAQDALARAREIDAIDVLGKPFDINDLLETLQRVLHDAA
jgi:CheY-like chemotaxis protein